MKSKMNTAQLENHPLHEKVMNFDFFRLRPRLEEIGAAASKEYSLEKTMEKMKAEWTDLRFIFSPYRDTVRKKKQHIYNHTMHFHIPD